jgi:hypothetical protein
LAFFGRAGKRARRFAAHEIPGRHRIANVCPARPAKRPKPPAKSDDHLSVASCNREFTIA